MNITTTHTLQFAMLAINGDQKIACEFIQRACRTADLDFDIQVLPAPEGKTDETRSVVRISGDGNCTVEDLNDFYDAMASAMTAIGVQVD